MPTYNDTPQATDRISATQPTIRTNFLSLETALGINHVVPINSGNAGKHTYIQLPVHAAPGTGVNEGGMYAAVGTYSGVTELYFERESSSAQIPMTETVWDAGNLRGWTRLPSGIIVKFGVIDWLAGGIVNNSFTLPQTPTVATFPAFTVVYNCQLTLLKGAIGVTDAYVQLQSITVTEINYNICRLSSLVTPPAVNIGIYYYIIGV